MADSDMKGQIWADAIWITRQESVTIGNVRREISVGMNVKNDYRATVKEIYPKAEKALEMLIEQERARWLNHEEMRELDSKIKEIEKGGHNEGQEEK